MSRRAPLRLVLARLREGRVVWQRLLLAAWLRVLRQGSDGAILPWRMQGPAGGPEATAAWIARFDTPDAGALAALARLPALHVQLVLDLAQSGPGQFAAVRAALDALVGVRWQARVRLQGPARVALAGEVARLQAGDPRYGADAIDASSPVALLVLRDGALPRPHAARVLAEAIGPQCRPPAASGPPTALAYCDETDLDTGGRPVDPWFKPAHSPLLVRQRRLPGGFYALPPATALPEDLDDPGYLAALAALPPGRVAHVPHILFHQQRWPAPQPAPGPKRAPSPQPVMLPQPAPPPRTPPAVAPFPGALVASVIIPTRNRWDLLANCLASLERTRWPDGQLDVIVVDNGSDDPATLHGLGEAAATGRIRVLRDPSPFNYARLNNRAAREARGQLLVLLNNDTEVRDPDWLVGLAAEAMAPDVGAVGCKLLFGNGTVQHAGIVLGVQGTVRHAHLGLPADAPGWQGLAATSREVSALTGACLAVRREAWMAVGGMDEQLPVTFNDVMLCLDLAHAGLRNVCLARPLLYHHESSSRGIRMTPAQRDEADRAAIRVWQRHPDRMAADPCYSPCLSLRRCYQLAAPPRRRPAWQAWSAGPAVILLLEGHAADAAMRACVERQASGLLAAGAEVLVGAPRRPPQSRFPGCRTLALPDPGLALLAAADLGVQLVVAHGAPFLGLWRECGRWPVLLACDHGPQPPPGGWPHALAEALDRERQMALGVLGARVLAAGSADAGVARILASLAGPGGAA